MLGAYYASRLYRSIKYRRREGVVHRKGSSKRSCCTGWLVGVLGLESAGGGLLVGALSGDLEGDTVGGLALHLEGGGGDMVEVLVQQLETRISLRRSSIEMAQCCAVDARGRDEIYVRSSYIVGQLGNIGEGWDGHDGGL